MVREEIEIIGTPPFKKVGIFISMLGVCGIIFVLSNASLSLGEKIPLGLFSLIVMIIGIFIETPLLGNLKEANEFHEFS